MNQHSAARKSKLNMLSAIVREPIVIFTAIAGLLFLTNAVISPEDFSQQTDRVEVSEGRIVQLAESYRLLTGRAPEAHELRNLIADFVDEEIAYREAVAMGLDRDDTVIRRRLRQKLEFVKLDTATVGSPTEEELRDWFGRNIDRYKVPERRALQVVTFIEDFGSPTVRAEVALPKLRAGSLPDRLGDSTLLPEALPLTSETGVARQFGDELAAAAFAAPVGRWIGPFKSNYGAHLVYVRKTAASHAPNFDRLRERILEDYTRAREAEALERIWRQMRARYDVVIDWPETKKGTIDPVVSEGVR